jgi:predicted Ser/Thr protein kinase
MHSTVFGKYQVVRVIGEGGFGRVFKGLDPDLKRPVAIKTCSLSDPDMRERFFREAEIAAKLHHPNITTVYDFGRQDGEPYLVQEYLTGEDLDHIIKRTDQLPLAAKIDYLVQVGEGLGYAHSMGVIHRDVKPANIRILSDGQVRIMDFGIARMVEETQRFTQAGMTIGTAGYLSPEQLQGLDVDQRSDIFSFGILAYELILQRLPFQGESISALFYAIAHSEPAPIQNVWSDCPSTLAACITRCLEKNRDVRYGDFREVTADLRNVLSSRPGEAAHLQGMAVAGAGQPPDAWLPASRGVKGAAGPPPSEATPSKRKRWLRPLLGLLGVALVVALFEVARLPGRSESGPPGEGGSTLDTGAAMVDSTEAGVRAEEGIVSPQGSEIPPAAASPTPRDASPTRERGEPEVPFRGSATLVLFWSVGGDTGSVTTAENAFLEELGRRRLKVVDAGLLAGIHGDASALAMAQGMDARSIAGLGREYDAEVVVVGSLRTEAAPSAGQFYTGRAVLDVRAYRASTAELLGSATYQVGSDRTPGKLGPSPLAAEAEAAKEVGRLAAVGTARDFGDALPRGLSAR